MQKEAINPFFSSKYITLDSLMEQVLPLLNRVGLVLTQFPSYIATQGTVVPALRTRIDHPESGEFLEDTSPLVMDKENPQGQGSAITYMRRYALMAALGLVADVDDDGNAASPKKAKVVASGSNGSKPAAAPSL